MAARIAQITIVLAVFGVLFVALVLTSVPPRPLLTGLAVPAALICVVIAIRPISRDAWDSFWEGLAGLFRWY
jgi:hypothetical protein